ncbi:MAG: exopolysaccharide biosynthesis polyprenyl glycosylphosphotransferase [Acetobacteraceae bacterium]|nr:exopolysaccharide biosynthesis polyprenyl glycosylphosphotransferase [Acetobacteraceae bacterium]
MLTDLLVVWDVAAVLSCGLAATFLHGAIVNLHAPTLGESGQFDETLIRLSSIAALLAPFVVRERVLRRPCVNSVVAIGKSITALTAIVLVVALTTRLVTAVPLPWMLAWFGSTTLAMLAGRASCFGLLGWTARRFGGERVAVIGCGAEADWLRRQLRQAGAAGVDLVSAMTPASLEKTVADLVEQGRQGNLDRVVLAMPGLGNDEIRRIAHGLKSLPIEVASLFPMVGAGALQRTTDLVDTPLYLVTRQPQRGYGGLSKRIIDLCFALALLLWTSPLLLLIALAIRLDSPGPILFRQRRHGLNGTEFDIYKFRTMCWQGYGAGNGAVQTRRRDRRVTRIGTFLRRSSLDEVPQLLNVLNGTMSLVGPRPHPTAMRTEARLGDEIVPEYPHRHRVKPGITGWAQINGLRGAIETADQLRHRIEHDNFYIENWSPWFDVRILAATPASLLFRRDNAF